MPIFLPHQYFINTATWIIGSLGVFFIGYGIKVFLYGEDTGKQAPRPLPVVEPAPEPVAKPSSIKAAPRKDPPAAAKPVAPTATEPTAAATASSEPTSKKTRIQLTYKEYLDQRVNGQAGIYSCESGVFGC
jgi:hypothetical protein